MTQQSTFGNLCVCVCLNLFSDAPKLSYVRGVSTYQDVCQSVYLCTLRLFGGKLRLFGENCVYLENFGKCGGSKWRIANIAARLFWKFHGKYFPLICLHRDINYETWKCNLVAMTAKVLHILGHQSHIFPTLGIINHMCS